MKRNVATPEGRELGSHLVRFHDQARAKALAKWPDMPERCKTCAFRAGDHHANGSPITVMTATACMLDGTEFYCHEPQREGALCMGWAALMIAREDGRKFINVDAIWKVLEPNPEAGQ